MNYSDRCTETHCCEYSDSDQSCTISLTKSCIEFFKTKPPRLSSTGQSSGGPEPMPGLNVGGSKKCVLAMSKVFPGFSKELPGFKDS